jgi:opacity protein-like surface antigen
MKLSLFATAAVAAAFAAAPALAQDAAAPSNYVQFNIGSGIAGQADIDATVTGVGSGSTDVDLDAGLFASVAGGHAFGNGFALEVEGVYAGNDGNEDDLAALFGAGTEASINTWGVLANARYEFNTGWNNVSPYVGAGIGYGAVNIDVDNGDDSQGGFMWQAKAGIVIHTNDQLAWDIGYRYLRAPQYDETTFVGGTTGSLTVDTGVHVLSAGARVSF